jgi:hypothetical protein
MLDCTKPFADLTLYEAYQCFLQQDFIGTTIGEWGDILLWLALFAAHIASYILPLSFIWNFIRRYLAKDTFVFDGKERGRKNFWGTYLVLSGFIVVALFYNDHFMFLQGAWEIVCGLGIFLLGPFWWARRRRSTRRSVA